MLTVCLSVILYALTSVKQILRQDVQMTFQTSVFLRDHWPKVGAMQAFLIAYGFTVQAGMIYRWYERDKIPAQWGLTLAALLEVEHGRPASLAKYLK